MNKNKTINRRKFFEKLLRGGLFAGLTASSAYFLLREKNTSDSCNFDFVCQNCRKSKHCQLPEASRFRFKDRISKENGQS